MPYTSQYYNYNKTAQSNLGRERAMIIITYDNNAILTVHSQCKFSVILFCNFIVTDVLVKKYTLILLNGKHFH